MRSRKGRFLPAAATGTVILWLALFLGGVVQAEVPVFVPRSEHRLFLALGSGFPLSEAIQRYQPFANYLGQKLGDSVDLVQIADGSDQVRRFLQGTLDLALMDGALYWKYRFHLELLGVEKTRGSLQRRALLVVPNGSPVHAARDLERGLLASPEEWDTLGTLWILSLVGKRGKVRFLRSSSYEGALRDVILGNAGGTAVDEQVYHRFLSRYPRYQGKLRVVATSPAFSNPVLAARKTLPEATREEMKRIIRGLTESLTGAAVLAATRTSGFVGPGPGFFNPEERLLSDLHLLGSKGEPDGIPAAIFAQ